MEEGQEMENSVKGGRNVEVKRQMDQVDETREDEMDEWIKKKYLKLNSKQRCGGICE